MADDQSRLADPRPVRLDPNYEKSAYTRAIVFSVAIGAQRAYHNVCADTAKQQRRADAAPSRRQYPAPGRRGRGDQGLDPYKCE
jgi:hypothetical protein